MPLSINQIPIPVPSSTDPANFSARGDTVFGAFPNFITQTNAVASEAAANRDSAEASKVAAANSETNAATYAANATTSANNASSSSTAPLWVSGTTYAINDKRVSPITGQVYRRKTAGAGTTDPSLDSTNWYAVLLDADTQYPSIKPTLNLDFANSGKLDPRITFTRASTATYYDGKTFAKAEENLLKHSQSFLTSSWKVTGNPAAPPTISASGSTAPDGTTGSVASVSFPVVSSGYSFIYQTSAASLVGIPVTGSIWVRVPTGTAYVFLNIEDSLDQPTLPGSAIAGSAVSVTTTWQRISLSGTRTAGSGFAGLIIGFDGRANAGQTNPSAFTLEIWGAQLEQRSSATAYTPTTSQPITKYQPVLKTASNNEPRFDYDPITLEAKGLLIEESRQNICLQSEDMSQVVWAKGNSSVSSNIAMSPDGNNSADKLIENTSNSNHQLLQNITPVAGTTYTFSGFFKGAGRGYAFLALIGAGQATTNALTVNLSSGIVSIVSGSFVSYSSQSVGNGWYRVTATITAITTAFLQIDIRTSIDGTWNNRAYLGDGSSGIYVWGTQLEAGTSSTSYIPTTSTPVTRQADNAAMTGTNFSSWYNQSEGTFDCICSGTTQSATGNARGVFAVSDGSSSNRIWIILSNASGSNSSYLEINTFGVQQSILGTGFTYTTTQRNVAFSYKTDDVSFCRDSGIIQTDNIASIPIVNQLGIGNAYSSFAMNGCIKSLAYYPKAIQQHQLQILTK